MLKDFHINSKEGGAERQNYAKQPSPKFIRIHKLKSTSSLGNNKSLFSRSKAPPPMIVTTTNHSSSRTPLHTPKSQSHSHSWRHVHNIDDSQRARRQQRRTMPSLSPLNSVQDSHSISPTSTSSSSPIVRRQRFTMSALPSSTSTSTSSSSKSKNRHTQMATTYSPTSKHVNYFNYSTPSSSMDEFRRLHRIVASIEDWQEWQPREKYNSILVEASIRLSHALTSTFSSTQSSARAALSLEVLSQIMGSAAPQCKFSRGTHTPNTKL